MTTRIPSSAAAARRLSSSARISGAFYALRTSGRFIVTRATVPIRSVVTSGCAMAQGSTYTTPTMFWLTPWLSQ